MKGSVKIMLSYDYNHFEVALASDEELDTKGINELRKKAQRLADEAVRQYKKAKDIAGEQSQDEYNRGRYLAEIERIEEIPEQERTIRQQAMLKQYQDNEWEAQFRHEYDYDDDENFSV